MEKESQREKKKRAGKEKKLIIQEMLSKRWEMLRWVTSFINDHKDSWEVERKLKEEEAYKELEKWNIFKRFEKIKWLQKRWQPEPEKENKEEEKDINDEENWKKLEVKKKKKQRKIQNLRYQMNQASLQK